MLVRFQNPSSEKDQLLASKHPVCNEFGGSQITHLLHGSSTMVGEACGCSIHSPKMELAGRKIKDIPINLAASSRLEKGLQKAPKTHLPVNRWTGASQCHMAQQNPLTCAGLHDP